MPRTIVFQTPGELDLRSITMMGLSSKPNSDSPIGMFGTGLKYTVAVLTRLGIPLKIESDSQSITFASRLEDFRGKSVNQIAMCVNGVWSDLPYTTEYGKFWELWQILRELQSNTVDEKGRSFEFNGGLRPKGSTWITVESDEFGEVFDGIGDIFLRGARRGAYSLKKHPSVYLTSNAQVITEDTVDVEKEYTPVEFFHRPNEFIYWRGVRVHALKRPSLYTWNITIDMHLTEDRTLKYIWAADQRIAQFIMESTDEDLINTCLGAKLIRDERARHYETSLDYNQPGVRCSKEFLEIAKKWGNESVLQLIAQKSLKDAKKKMPWHTRLKLAIDEENWGEVTALISINKKIMQLVIEEMKPSTLNKIKLIAQSSMPFESF